MSIESYRENVVIALCEPRDVVNVAGAVRAMMNMGLRRLRLINPMEYDTYRIEGIAHGADVVLERCELFDTLEQATAEARLVVGTTARRRTAKFVWSDPRQAAPELVRIAGEDAGPVVIVFGREDTGLTNEELDLCDRLLRVPTDPERWSLNLAQAVLLVAYELWLEAGAGTVAAPTARRSAPAAGAAELRATFAELERMLATVDFFKTRNPPSIMRTLRALIRRSEPDAQEARLLRAVAIEVRKYLDRETGRSD